MNQSVFKQLLLLAILLFAGIGSAFGKNEIHVTVSHENVAEVTINDQSSQSKTHVFEFENGTNCTMSLKLLDESYILQSVTINNKDVDVELFNNYGYDFGYLSDSEFVVNIVLEKARIITLYRDGTRVGAELQRDGWDVAPCEETNGFIKWKTVSGQSYNMRFGLLNGWTYRLKSITVDAEPYDLDQYYEKGWRIYFDNNTSDHAVRVDIEKNSDDQSVGIKTIIVDRSNFWVDGMPRGSLEFADADDENNWYMLNYDTNEFLSNKTIRMRIPTEPGWQVADVTLDNTNVTSNYLANGYLEFEDNADHTVSVVFGTATTHSITTQYNNGNIYLNGNWCYPNEAKLFNEGSNVIMTFPSTCQNSVWDEAAQTDIMKLYAVSLPIKIDNSEVTPTKNENGDYEYTFENLIKDHTVTVNYVEVPSNTITVNFNDNWGQVFLNGRDVGSGKQYLYETGKDVEMTLPAEWWDNDIRYKPTITVTSGDGEPELVDLSKLEQTDDGQYVYRFTLTADLTINVVYEPIPQCTITVNCLYNSDPYNDHFHWSLNNEGSNVGQPYSFDKGSDVTFSIYEIPDGKVLESIKIGDNDITGNFNGSYTISKLTENQTITLTFVDADESYYLNASFDEMSYGKIFIKTDMTEKQEQSWAKINKGSKVTIFVKAPIGYEVSKIHLIMDEVTEEDAVIYYKSDTKEYCCDITITAPTSCEITTQKKPSGSTTEVSYTLSSGMATFCSEYDLDFSKVTGISAYVANRFDSETRKLVMMKVTKVPAGTGLLIAGAPGTYQIPVAASSLYYHNLLKPVAENTTVPDSDWSDVRFLNYVLDNDNGQFNRGYGGTPISAYQAYLSLPQYLVGDVESVSIELMDMGDMNGDKKVTITDAIMILDEILTTP